MDDINAVSAAEVLRLVQGQSAKLDRIEEQVIRTNGALGHHAELISGMHQRVVAIETKVHTPPPRQPVRSGIVLSIHPDSKTLTALITAVGAALVAAATAWAKLLG